MTRYNEFPILGYCRANGCHYFGRVTYDCLCPDCEPAVRRENQLWPLTTIPNMLTPELYHYVKSGQLHVDRFVCTAMDKSAQSEDGRIGSPQASGRGVLWMLQAYWRLIGHDPNRFQSW